MVRTEPVQQRSAQRVAHLLDTAALLIDELGIDALTTSDVAARSDSSVGVVYRYFPNIQSLLRALAARNLARFTETIYDRLSADSVEWLQTVDVAIDTFIEFNRAEPGFRALRFGDIIDDRFLDPEFSNNGVFARALVGPAGREVRLHARRQAAVRRRGRDRGGGCSACSAPSCSTSRETSASSMRPE